jgi:hypothetical protein
VVVDGREVVVNGRDVVVEVVVGIPPSTHSIHPVDASTAVVIGNSSSSPTNHAPAP